MKVPGLFNEDPGWPVDHDFTDAGGQGSDANRPEKRKNEFESIHQILRGKLVEVRFVHVIEIGLQIAKHRGNGSSPS